MKSLVFAIAVLFAANASAQDGAAVPPATVALKVDSGLALRLIMTEKLRFKANEPVRAKITDPVYAFDREVISSGTEVAGRIIGFRRPSRFIRVWSMMGGNFTPLREPQIEFDRLLLSDGRSIALSTDVGPGTNAVIRFDDSTTAPKGRIARAKDQARQQIEARKKAIIDAVKGPGKWAWIRDRLWSFSPWRPQSLPAGTRFAATLRSPIDFGTATLQPGEIDQVGSTLPPDAVISAVLATDLDSSKTPHGTPVQAILSRPVFSEDQHLIFPEGTRLVGSVVQAKPARRWHRNGTLAFMFTGIDPSTSAVSGTPGIQQIEGRLDSVEVDSSTGNVKLDEEGGVRVQNSNTRFIAPAVAALLSMRTTEGRDHEPDGDADDVGLKPGQTIAATNHVGANVLAGGIGFGFIGAALGRLASPIATTLGFYGVGRLAYSNIVGRGQEISFSRNTPVEIRMTSPASPAP
jgi:hypothetical protein